MLKGKKIKEDIHIYILSNLHSTTFKAVVTHELLHVFLFINNYTHDLTLERVFVT